MRETSIVHEGRGTCGGSAFPGVGKRRWDETRVAQLERKVGQQALEIDFLKGWNQAGLYRPHGELHTRPTGVLRLVRRLPLRNRVNPDIPAVHFDNQLRQGQSQTGS